jgi:predicted metalloendopeptidase
MRDVQLTMNRYAVADLDALMPAFGLSGYVASLGVTQPSVSVDNPGFFVALDATLADTSIETLRDYLRWHLVRTFASALSPAFELESFDFYGRTLGGQQEMQPRWKRVLNAASADIGELVAQLYVDAAFSPHAKKRCEDMVDHLLSAMGRAIRDAEWMTEATREEALRKLDGFHYKIGFPDEWRDYTGLVIERASYAENRMRCQAFEFARQMGRLGEPVDRRRVAHVGGMRERVATRRGDGVDRGLFRVGGDVVDDDARPFGREPQCRRPTDAGSSAGDHCDLAVQLSGHEPS